MNMLPSSSPFKMQNLRNVIILPDKGKTKIYIVLGIPASRVFLAADAQLLGTSLAGAETPLRICLKSLLKLNASSLALPRSTLC